MNKRKWYTQRGERITYIFAEEEVSDGRLWRSVHLVFDSEIANADYPEVIVSDAIQKISRNLDDCMRDK